MRLHLVAPGVVAEDLDVGELSCPVLKRLLVQMVGLQRREGGASLMESRLLSGPTTQHLI